MNKDVIYVDIEDDITSIIEKVKNAKQHIVALVPPKRIGVLQSAVNLKLLVKAANNVDKRVVLITTNAALTALASGAQLPVAKNLQSKPELIETTPEDDSDDVINGSEIAVGELDNVAVASRRGESEDKEVSAAVAVITGEDKKKREEPAKKKAKKIPNYSKFRKRLFLFGGLGVLLIAFLVWAIGFAPRAEIVVTAKTTGAPISAALSLDSSVATNADVNKLQPIVKQIKKTNSIDFDATGSKEVGQPAKGTVTISNCSESDPVSLPAGTTIANGSYQFTLDQAVTVPGMRMTGGSCKPGVSSAVGVTAVNIGPEYNLATGMTYVVSGFSSSVFSATSQSAFTGGSRETVTVVQQSDVDKATDELKKQDASNQAKSELITQMGEGVTVIDESFVVSLGNVVSNPPVGEQTKRASVGVEVTYTIMGISDRDLNEQLDVLAKKTMSASDNQKIYDNGLKNVRFKDYQVTGNGSASVTILATAQIGPKLDEEQIKTESANKRSGEIRETLGRIPGVEDVRVDFWPFWVNKAPGVDKITVTFTVNE